MQEKLSEQIRTAARELGFSQVGIAPAVTPTGFHRLLEWLSQGYSADMTWMERRQDAYRHPDGVMPGTRSVIMAAMNYFDGTSPAPGARVARYASGSADYHETLKARLKQLSGILKREVPTARTRIVVDTAPLLERDFGRLAGIGWFGKNTMLISRAAGSWFFLGAILTDLDLPYDTPEDKTWCGTCTRCLDACPTQAFPEPGVLDARKCISYLTIELRNAAIPDDLRDGVGPWLFGCDICQEVCPWNRFAPTTVPDEFRNGYQDSAPDCRELLTVSEEQFQQRFSKTPLARPGRSGLLRNAAIVLGNQRDSSARPELLKAAVDPDPLIREAANWALERCDSALKADNQSPSQGP